MMKADKAVDENKEEHGVVRFSTPVLAPMLYSTLQQKQQGVIEYFQCQCGKPWFLEEFHDFRQQYSEPIFQANHYLSSPDSKCMQIFESALLLIKDTDFLQVAFHGTRASNVTSILQKGLDPMLRNKGFGGGDCLKMDGTWRHEYLAMNGMVRKYQHFGAGEYFTVDPSAAAKYCNCIDGETLRIVVCTVILPKYPSKEHIVIKNPNHHIPIGIRQGVKSLECFMMLNEDQRQMLARRSINFHKRLQHCELPEQIERIKCLIVLDLKRKEPAMASDLYRRFSAVLRYTRKQRDIAKSFGSAFWRRSHWSRVSGLVGVTYDERYDWYWRRSSLTGNQE
jgi:Poly(ADP-ribose) polymerase catalytic domain